MKLQGEVARDGANEVKLKEIGILSVAPGSQSMMLELNDSPSAQDLASIFGTDAVVMRGFDLTTDKGVYYLQNFNIVLSCKRPVALVMRRYRHDCASSISH